MPIFRCVLSGLMYGQLWQNRLFFNSQDPRTEQDMAALVRDHWIGNTRLPLPADVQFLSVMVQNVTNNTLAFTLPLQNVRGAQLPDDQLNTVMSWKLLFKTGLAGKKFRGRHFVPGVLKGFHTQNFLNSAGVNQWAGALAGLRGVWLGQSPEAINLIIRGDGPEPHNTTVTAIELAPILGVQRRRNTGVGL